MPKSSKITTIHKPLTTGEIRNRITSVERLRFGDIANHPKNPKLHPDGQRFAFRGAVREIGFTSVPCAYRNAAGALTWCDGHLRGSEVADYVGEVAILDLSEGEALQMLAYQDPVAGLAELDQAGLDALLREIQPSDAALQELLAGLAVDAGLYGLGDSDGAGSGGSTPLGKSDESNEDKVEMMMTCPHCGGEFLK